MLSLKRLIVQLVSYGVVLVETADFPSKKQLYMGITRANRELRLIDSKGLPPAIHKWVREQN
jgi:hypothetical protein